MFVKMGEEEFQYTKLRIRKSKKNTTQWLKEKVQMDNDECEVMTNSCVQFHSKRGDLDPKN
jgi:NAD dependent epimerase/dehydratase family enzyme